MARECEGLTKRPGEHRRRLFSDGPHMLFVWCDQDDEPVGFQLIYETGMGRYVLTRRADGSVTHNRMDEGAGHQGHSVSPVLALNGQFDIDRVLPAFIKRSTEIDPAIRLMVVQAMHKAGPAKCV